MTISTKYSDFKDFTRQDTALRSLRDLPCSDTKVTLVYHKRLMFTPEIYNKNNINNSNQTNRDFYLAFNRYEETLKLGDFQTVLRNKRKIFKEQLEPHIGYEWCQHLSFFHVFVKWAAEMIDIYKLNNPEDLEANVLEMSLLSKLAAWELEIKKQGTREVVTAALEVWFLKLKDTVPDSDRFCSMWAAFSQILFDTDPRWTPTILVMELDDYLEKQYRKPNKDPAKITRLFQREIPVSQLRSMWSSACIMSRNNWRRVVPEVQSLCANGYAYNLGLAKALTCQSDEAQIMKMLSTWYLSVNDLLAVEHANIPEALDTLKNCPIELLHTHEDLVFQLRSFYVRYSTAELLPHAHIISVVEEEREASLAGFEEPKKVANLIQMHRHVIRYAHQLLNTFTALCIYEVSHLYEVSLKVSQAVREAERRKAIIEENARKNAKKKNAPRKKASVAAKENKVNQPHSASTSTTGILVEDEGEISAKAESIVQAESESKPKSIVQAESESKPESIVQAKEEPIAPKQQSKAPAKTVRNDLKAEAKKEPAAERPSKVQDAAFDTACLAISSFRSLLVANSSQAQQNAAAHADLYRVFLAASHSTLERFGTSPEHALNTQRLGHHTAGTGYESTLHFKASLIEKDLKIVGHNLWQLFKKVPVQAIESSISELHLVSSAVRFTHELNDRIQNLQMRVQRMPSVLARLLAVREGNFAGAIAPLEKILGDAMIQIDQMAAQMGGKKQHPEIANTERKLYNLNTDQVEELLDKVLHMDGVNNPWLKQWKDDLICLASTCKLLSAKLQLKERALLIAHMHFILHSVVQSGLYALRIVKGKPSTQEHDLRKLWMDLEGCSQKALVLSQWLHNANGASRYPFTYSEIQSPLHRMQLEEILKMFRPEVQDGFNLSGYDSESSLAQSQGWSPFLKNISTNAEQQVILASAVKEVCAFITSELLPMFLSAPEPSSQVS